VKSILGDINPQTKEGIQHLANTIRKARRTIMENMFQVGGWQQNKPEPLRDEGHYDIILDDDRQKNNVEYWAFGGGFCSHTEEKSIHLVDYLLSDVKYYKISDPQPPLTEQTQQKQ
jgi:hypothetical protein